MEKRTERKRSTEQQIQSSHNGRRNAIELGRTKQWEYLSTIFGIDIPNGIVVTGIESAERDILQIDGQPVALTRNSFLYFLDGIYTMTSKGAPGLLARTEYCGRYVYRLKEELRQHGITDPDFYCSGCCPTASTLKPITVIPELLINNADHRIRKIFELIDKKTPELIHKSPSAIVC